MLKKKREILAKWILPIAGFLVVLLVLVVQFTASSHRRAVSGAEAMMELVMKEYQEDTVGEIEYMTSIGIPVSYIIESYQDVSSLFALDACKLLAQESDAEVVVFADLSGSGKDQYGRRVDLSDKEYVLTEVGEGEQAYFYMEGDEVMETPAIVSVIPIENEGQVQNVLYLFYPIDLIRQNYYSTELYGTAQMMIVDGEGQSILSSGTSSYFLKGIDIYTLLEESGDREASTILRMGIREQTLRILPLDKSIEGCSYLAVIPLLEGEDMFLTVFFNESYVKGLISTYWTDTKYLVFNMVAALALLLALWGYVVYRMKAEFKVTSHELEEKADKDLLTDIYNKITTEEKIREYVALNHHSKGIFCLVDIDNFKNINDTRGHAFGDQVLKEIALRLETAFRATDIVGRIGVDEFLVFVKDLPEHIPVEVEAKKIEHVFHDFRIGEYVKYSVTASIGISTYPVDGVTFEDLYNNADKAVYIAKKQGKNRAVVYNSN